jgi:hypothetical protein
MTVNIAVIYHSATGTAHALAQAGARGCGCGGSPMAPDGAIAQNNLPGHVSGGLARKKTS